MLIKVIVVECVMRFWYVIKFLASVTRQKKIKMEYT